MSAVAKTIKTGLLHRAAEFDRATLNEEKRTVELSFSSEEPVQRWFGYEILDHKPESVDLRRINLGGPLLMDHNTRDQIGVIEEARIGADKKGRARVRFGSSTRAKEIFQDVKDGIRTNISVGYRVLKLVTEKIEKEVETLRATSWLPLEISIVSVPADTTVGIGRDDEPTFETTIETQRTEPMNPTPAPAPAQAPTPGLEVARTEGATAERNRIAEINAMAAKLDGKIPDVRQIADAAIASGKDTNEFRRDLFEKLPGVQPIADPKPKLGMDEREIEKYSIRRAVVCACTQRFDGLEGEMHQEAERQYKNTGTPRQCGGPNSIIIPYDVLSHSKRDALVSTGSLGGNLVATNLLAGSFIELLRTRMLVSQMGAQFISGLVGNVAIPRQTGGATLYWAASEAAATTESNVTFDQVTMTPKQATARVDYSYLTLLQTTPGIEMLLRNDLSNIIARGIDLAALHGSGSGGQPTGIAATSGIGSVAGGTHGAAPTWANIVSLESEVSNDNADIGSLGYLTNSRVRGKLKTTLKNSTGTDATFIWKNMDGQVGFGDLNGYKAGVSNQVSNTLTKGTSTTVCSAIFFGNWSDLLIGQWGGLEILVNPYTQAANRVYELYAYQAVDISVRHPESFAAMLDALTT